MSLEVFANLEKDRLWFCDWFKLPHPLAFKNLLLATFSLCQQVTAFNYKIQYKLWFYDYDSK